MMSLRCTFGRHAFDLVHATRATETEPSVPARWRCCRCGREKKLGVDNSDRKTEVRFAGHLTAREVQRITKWTGRPPVYVAESVRKELAAAAAATKGN